MSKNKIEIDKVLVIYFILAVIVGLIISGSCYWAEQKGIETGKNQTLSNITLMSEVGNQYIIYNLNQYNGSVPVYVFDAKTNQTMIFQLNNLTRIR